MRQKSTQSTNRKNRTPTERRYLFIVKWPKRFLIFLLFLVLFLFALLQLPATQDFIKTKTLTKLENDLNTRISISDFKFSLFNGFYLKDLVVEDLQQDTLLQAKKLKVSLEQGIFSLFYRNLFIKDIEISGAQLNINYPENQSGHNAQFILDYFQSNSKKKNKISLALNSLLLDDVRFHSQNDRRKKNFDAYLGKGVIFVDSINLNHHLLAIKSIDLVRPIFSIFKHTRDSIQTNLSSTVQPKDSIPWSFSIEDLSIQKGLFSSDDFGKSFSRDTTKDLVDFNHLDLSAINMKLTNFVFDSKGYSGRLNQFNLVEESGFEIQNLRAQQISITNRKTEIIGLNFKTPSNKDTPGTLLTDYLSFKYNGYNDFKSFRDKVFIKLKLQDSKIALRDILFFSKKLKANRFFKLNQDKSISVSGNFAGMVENPRANNLNISIGQTSMIGKIKVNSISDKAHASINLDVQEIRTDIPTLKLLIPGFLPPANMNTLGKLVFKGKFEGFINQFVAYGQLKTDIGEISVDMNLDISQGTELAKYSGKISVIDFDLSQWMNNEHLGLTSFHTTVKDGGGIRLNTAHALLNGEIKKFVFKKYVYQNIILDGKLEQNFFDGKLKSEDPNINLNFNGQVDFTDSIAKYNFDSKILNLDLFALHLSKKPLNISGVFDLDFSARKLKEISGKAKINQFKLFNARDSFFLDSAYVAANLINPTKKHLTIQSSLVDANMKGIFDLATLPLALKAALISRSPAFAQKINIIPDSVTVKKQDFDFSIKMNSSQNITQLLGLNIDTIVGLNINGKFNNQAEKIRIHAHINGINIGTKSINNTGISIRGEPNKLSLRANVFEIQLNKNRSLPPIALNLSIFPDTLTFRLKASNFNNVLKNVRFNGIVLPMDDYYQLQFSPSNIQLEQDNWMIDSDNYFRFSKQYLEAKNILFVSQQKQFKLTTPTNNSLRLDLNNFDLSFINSLYYYKNFQYKGPFTANIQFNNVQEKKDLQLHMEAANIDINEQAFGSFLLKAKMQDFQSPVDVDLDIGKGTLATTGYIHFAKTASTWKGKNAPPKSILLNGKLKSFPFNVMEAIIPNGISKTAGKFDGIINIEGPLSGPEFDGYADILNGELTIDYLQTHYYINNQRIKVNTLQFDATDQILTDIHGQTARITGGIRHKRFKDFSLDVSISSGKFLVLDTKKGDNALFYGKTLADFYAIFTGNFSQPNLRIVGSSLAGTNLSLSFSDQEEIGETNFVNFVSFAKEHAQKEKEEEILPGKTGLDIQMSFTLTDEADIKLIFDETSGDIIQSKGNGDFHLTFSRFGEFHLNGEYVITKGEYLFTLMNFINKPFTIKPGGTITWRKDPMAAVINIKAVLQGLSAPVHNLIKEELKAFGNSSDISTAQQPSPIDLGLILTGPMLQPNIDFSILVRNLIGTNKNYVDSKLSIIQNDPHELNRQVFGLLVFGNFLPPGNSLGLENGGNVGTGIASTISELLSSQFARHINSLLADIVGTGKFYSGVEVDVGVNIYQTYQQGTLGEDPTTSRAFNFNLKNHFFNNRVTVQLGGNFDVSADNQPNPTSTSDFAGDILIEVVLSENRRYRMQVYNRFAPDHSGSKTRRKTGFGLSYKREFNSFFELFKGMKKAIRGNEELTN